MQGSAIEARGLVKRYRTREGGLIRGRYTVVEALRGVSFKVPWGTVFGLLGPNGAGKTTTVKIIATLLEPDEGDAFVAGYSSIHEPIEVRKRIGVMLSVEKGFFWKLTGIENLKYFGMLYGLTGRILEERVREVLEVTGLAELSGDRKRFEDMSLGMRARLGLARALLKDPPVLILDEPTLGLDPASARHIRMLLRELAKKRGKAILLTTHNMFEAEIVCDHVAIMSRGRIIAEGAPEELKRMVQDKSPVIIVLRGDRWRAERLAAQARNVLGYPASLSEKNGSLVLRIIADQGAEERVIASLAGQALENGLKLVEARVETPSLEDVFIQLTRGDSSEPKGAS
ncbi:MAG: ABC transporter ATP-binding protein [Pyrodictiaceae archaeon]